MTFKKTYTLSTVVLLSVLSASCGSRIDYSSNPGLDQDISTLSTIRDDGKDILAKTNASYADLKDFSCNVTILDSKTGNPQDTDIGETKFIFKKLRKEKAEITKSSDPKKVGTFLLYLGTDKVTILLPKPIPFLGRKFTLAVNDKRVSTSRGYPFDQLDMTAMLNRLNNPAVKTSFLGEGVVNGRKTLALEGIGTFKSIDPEVTREVVQVDAETLLPIQDEVFIDGNKTVLKINVNELKLNLNLPDNLFTLPDVTNR
jgi:outer membrane lipoprotein-sorting protein